MPYFEHFRQYGPKLERLGIVGYFLRWFPSYLTGRKLSVMYVICNSQYIEFLATSGIPQESHLGPMIFLLYYKHRQRLCFNDVNNVLYRSISDGMNLQQDINSFVARYVSQ